MNEKSWEHNKIYSFYKYHENMVETEGNRTNPWDLQEKNKGKFQKYS